MNHTQKYHYQIEAALNSSSLNEVENVRYMIIQATGYTDLRIEKKIQLLSKNNKEVK
jgi:hypothetical protein